MLLCYRNRAMTTPLARWREVPVFLHGITPGEAPASHEEQYSGLLEGVAEALADRGKGPLESAPVFLEWGWENGGRNRWPDAALARTERLVRRSVEAVEDPVWDTTLNPARLQNAALRRAFIHGFADLFYYGSVDGETALREHLFGELARLLAPAAETDRVSVTLFAHSTGTLIAHDFLWHLAGSPEPHPAVSSLRGLRREGRLRVRRFYTLGSPLAPLLCRSTSLVTHVESARKLELADLALGRDDALPGPRWLNFWDRDDLFSYPLGWAYASGPSGGAVEDRRVDLGDTFPSIHGRYWFDGGVASAIAENW